MPLERRYVELITECATKIRYLEETVKEIKQELRDLRIEKNKHKERISDRRLATYLAIASIIGGFVGGIVLLIIQKALGL